MARRLSLRRSSQRIAALVAAVTAVSAGSLVVMPSLGAQTQVGDLYIAPGGLDTNPGTIDAPFLTLQRCADIVTAGRRCVARGGIYRETVVPRNSGTASAPIIFASYPGETALISGADVVTGFTGGGGRSIVSLGWDLGEGNNQVFLNGKMLIEARYPNATDVFQKGQLGTVANPQGSGTTWTFDAPGLPASAVGANINILPGPEWVMETAKVTAVQGNRLTLSGPRGQLSDNSSWDPNLFQMKPGNPFFVWGKLDLLDSPTEWFVGNGQLYLGQNPGASTVEVKRRQYAFDLDGKSNIRIEGFHIFASTIKTGDIENPAASTSSNVTLDGVHIRYPSHFTAIVPISSGSAWSVGIKTGVLLYGTNHSIRNSSIAWSAGNGVGLAGAGHRIENNIVHHVDYAMTDAAAIYTGLYDTPSTGNPIIERNTMFTAGRSVLVHRNTTGARIVRNHMYDAGLLASDLGITYTYETDGAGSEIAYNLMHDNKAANENIGLYLDNFSRNYLVHHNIVFNVDNALTLNLPSTGNRVYNNTFEGRRRGMQGGAGVLSDCDATGSTLVNNIFLGEIALGYVFDGTPCPNGTGRPSFSNNIEDGTDPKFNDIESDNFGLRPDSPAINAGRDLGAITAGFAGSAPDLGALEFGQDGLDVGATISEPCVYGDACAPPPPPPLQNGLLTEFFSDQALSVPVGESVQPIVNLANTPISDYGLTNEDFSVRWSGFITAPTTGVYTLTVTADDGARLFIDNKPLINRWDWKPQDVDVVTVSLTAGQRVPITLEMHQWLGGYSTKLEWSYAGQSKTLVPTQALSPA